jgi:hypothetical protein
MTNSRFGINTTSPGRLLDVNGDVSFNSDKVYWDSTTNASLTAGNVAYGASGVGTRLFPGHTSLINLTAPTLSYAHGTILTNVLADTTLAIGQLVYYRGGTGRWALADASAAATSDFLLGIVVQAAATTDSTTSILIDGLYSTPTYYDGIGAVGDIVFISETAGNVTANAPTTAASIVRGVGQVVALNTTTFTINFRPDSVYCTNG